MPSSLLDAPRLSLTEAARSLGVHVSTLHRWRLKGLRGRKLRFVRCGAKSYILRDELEQFIAAMSDPPTDVEQAADFAERAAAANAKCAALGL
ncbi:MAG: helix-turn-helix domain-containing protein [Planctomycetaceae bacterium]